MSGHMILSQVAASAVADVATEVVRCSDCAVPHNRWTGCPNLNGMIPTPDFYCARGVRKQQDAAAANPDAQRAAMHMESMINSYNALKKTMERLPDELREKIVDRACEAISKMEEGLRDE